MLRDKMERGTEAMFKVGVSIFLALLLLAIPLGVLYLAVRVIRMAWGA